MTVQARRKIRRVGSGFWAGAAVLGGLIGFPGTLITAELLRGVAGSVCPLVCGVFGMALFMWAGHMTVTEKDRYAERD